MASFSTLCTAGPVTATLLLSSATSIACPANSGWHDGLKGVRLQISWRECLRRDGIFQLVIIAFCVVSSQWVGSERKEERKRGKRSLLRGARVQARLGRWRLLKPILPCSLALPLPLRQCQSRIQSRRRRDRQTITSGARR